MKLTIADLEFKFKQIWNQLEETEGELTEEIQDALAINKEDFEERIENYHLIINQNLSDIERLKLLKSNLDNKIAYKTKVNAYISELIKDAIKIIVTPKQTELGYNTYKTEIGDITINMSPSVAVNIIDYKPLIEKQLGKFNISLESDDINTINKLKKIYPDVKSEFVADKNLIKNKLKNKEEVKGAELQVNYNLKFK